MNDIPAADPNAIVAVSLLTAEELRKVGTSLKQVYPVPQDGKFDDLLKALDRADARGSGISKISFFKARGTP